MTPARILRAALILCAAIFASALIVGSLPR